MHFKAQVSSVRERNRIIRDGCSVDSQDYVYGTLISGDEKKYENQNVITHIETTRTFIGEQLDWVASAPNKVKIKPDTLKMSVDMFDMQSKEVFDGDFIAVYLNVERTPIPIELSNVKYQVPNAMIYTFIQNTNLYYRIYPLSSEINEEQLIRISHQSNFDDIIHYWITTGINVGESIKVNGNEHSIKSLVSSLDVMEFKQILDDEVMDKINHSLTGGF